MDFWALPAFLAAFPEVLGGMLALQESLQMLAGVETNEGLYMGQAVTAQDSWREPRIFIG